MAWADSVRLVNGDRLSGSVVRMDAESLWLSTPYAADLKLPRSQVIRIETDAPVQVRLDDGTTIGGRLQGDTNENVRIHAASLGTTAALPIRRIAAINPPQHPDRTKLSGSASVGGSVASGNTDAQMLYLAGELVARNPSQRVTLDAEFNRAEQDGVDTAENARLGMQYDQFLARRTYLYASARFDHDAQADLDLRSTIGAGAGWQLLDRDAHKLSVEGGLSLVNEDYGSASDARFPGARLGLRYEQTLWQGRLALFHTSDLLLSLEEIDDALYRSRTGVRVPMGRGLAFGAQVNADYDAVPAPGKQTTDSTLIFKLDYTL